MEAHEIPEECLSNTQFAKVLKATLETEIKTKQQEIKDIQEQIETFKKSVEYQYAERKKLKQLLECEKDKKTILSPTLKILRASYEEKALEFKLLQTEIDCDSLRMKDEQSRYHKIIENYRKTWEIYQGEYEKSELAIKRNEIRKEVEKAKVKNMILQYDKTRLFKMLKQRELIDDLRLKVMITKMSKLVLERWDQQKQHVDFRQKIKNLNEEFHQICEKHKILQREVEEEAKARDLARQLMPAPRLDNSLLRSIYANTPRQIHRESRLSRELSVDLDTISVNSSIIEQLYSGNENAINALDTIGSKNVEEDESLVQEVYLPSDAEKRQDAEQSEENAQNDSSVHALETVCRQLSIDDSINCDVYAHKELEIKNNSQAKIITCEALIETHKSPQNIRQEQIQKKLSMNNELINKNHQTNPYALKKKLSVNDKNMNDDTYLQQPETKKFKMFDLSHDNVAITSKLSDVKVSTKLSSIPGRSTPKIQKIETIKVPIKIQGKPPMAEVPPTPANLLPNRHYAASHYASSENLSMVGDSNFHETDADWKNFSSSQRSESVLSFMSDTSMFKNMVQRDAPAISTNNSNVQMNLSKPEKQSSNNLATNFLNFFGTSKPNTHTFF